ncbi:MAG: aldo/keto reductase [Guyparkeria sp.]|uniref:aldo/keto reductase n=1 Tax=Guyparkeria sp. TaxID=2035736 RepID=UPI00397A7C25
MVDASHLPGRRRLLRLAGCALALGTLPALARASDSPSPNGTITRAIPASDERLPVIGMGTWITFNVGQDEAARARRTAVLRTFFERGGRLVDSSPMYGSAEAVIGHALERLEGRHDLFAASKVWTPSGSKGRAQIERSAGLWGIERFDLMQIHNLVAWEAHMETLLAMRESGRLRYVGITTSHGRRHDDIERIMRDYPIDFVQASYSLANREVEDRILPLAREKGIAFIANRPFQGGRLIDRVKRHPLPDWAPEAGMHNWAEFLLKFIAAHPDVTCAIPATSRVEHMRENMGALAGPLPDEAMRRRMVEHVRGL